MIKKLNTSLKIYNLSAMLLGILALFAVCIAQLSSNSCIAWTLEQPKMPDSLRKSD
jgi:cyclic lactone autoinducer peptide